MTPDALNAEGWLAGAQQIASPSCDERPAGELVRLIVIHNISLPPGQFGGDAVIELFTNCLDWDADPYYAQIRGMRVSSHFFIRRDGSLFQFVPCAKRAWHAGVSCWRGRERCNDFSLGIELEGSDEQPFSEAQYASLNSLIAMLTQTYPIEDIVGHSDIAPGRKTDPGPHFDWARVARNLD